MADDASNGEQPNLPGIKESDLRAAEKRAEEATKRAEALEAADRKRQADADKRRKADEVKTVDDAKRAVDDAMQRAEAAEKRASEAEERYCKRVDARFETLNADTRERINAFRDHMPVDQWERLVEMELERQAPASDGGVNAAPGDAGGLPPSSVSGAGRRVHREVGRELHPRTVEILNELGQDTRIARKVIDVETEVEGGVKRGRFIYPQGLLKRHLRERALAPVLMTEENRRKIFGE